MSLENLKILDCSPKALKKFNFIFTAVLLVWSGLLFWHGKGIYKLPLCLSVLFFFSALIKPVFTTPFYKFWMTLTAYLGIFFTSAVLVTFYMFILTPIAWLARLSGKKFMEAGFKDNESTFWITKTYDPLNKSRYENQF